MAGNVPVLGSQAANMAHILVDLYGRIMSLGEVYNEAQMIGTRTRWSGLELSLLRQSYEAYALFSFMQLVFACYGGPKMLAQHIDVSDSMHRRGNGPLFVRKVRLGVLQYAVFCGAVVPLATLLALQFGHFHEGLLSREDVYPYCAALQCLSQTWALCCLVQLLRLAKRDLAPVRPLLKFMCLKLLIFFTWLQSMGILMLENLSSLGQVSLWIETTREERISHWWDPFGVFDSTRVTTVQTDAWQRQDVRCYIGSGLGSLLLCLEMVGFAVLHCHAYPSSEWDARLPACPALQLAAQLEAGMHNGGSSSSSSSGGTGRSGLAPPGDPSQYKAAGGCNARVVLCCDASSPLLGDVGGPRADLSIDLAEARRASPPELRVLSSEPSLSPVGFDCMTPTCASRPEPGKVASVG